MNNVFGWVIGPDNILLAGLKRLTYGMNAWHEFPAATELINHGAAHAGHDAHIDGYIWAVR